MNPITGTRLGPVYTATYKCIVISPPPPDIVIATVQTRPKTASSMIELASVDRDEQFETFENLFDCIPLLINQNP